MTKLWSYFISKPPPAKTLRALERLYVERDHAVGPVVERILMHPALYQGPAMVKPLQAVARLGHRAADQV